MKSIQLSINRERRVTSKADGATITRFKIETLDLADDLRVKDVFRHYVHSTNIWEESQPCSSTAYRGMVGITLDADDGIVSLEQAKQRFAGFNHVIYTTTNHLEEKDGNDGAQDRFRVILFFDPEGSPRYTDPVEADAVYSWAKDNFPEYDAAPFERARKFYPNTNPDISKFIIEVQSSGKWFAIGEEQLAPYREMPSVQQTSNTLEQRYLDHNDMILFNDGKRSMTVELLRTYLLSRPKQKQPCYCPFCDDINSVSASAFVQLESNGYVKLFCSHCKSEWDAATSVQKEKLQYLYRENPMEPGMFMLEDKPMRVKVWHQDAAPIRLRPNYIEPSVRESVLATLARTRSFATQQFSVEKQASAAFDKLDYSLDVNSGTLSVEIPSAIQPKMKDNAFIDKWLDGMFGKHSDFIRDWMALYSFTNYQQLPVIILQGERGTGKTTFAEILGEIFPTMYDTWNGEQGNFTSHFSKKLLFVDENDSNKKSQYVQLKMLTGNRYLTINEKYVPGYRIRNNAHFILATNQKRPMFFAADERPLSEETNNFFIHEMPKLTSLDPMLRQKLLDHLGHYVRTELKRRYESWLKQRATSGARYGIPCPITELEEKLFDTAATGVEAEAEMLAEAVVLGLDMFAGRLGGGSHIKKSDFKDLVNEMRFRSGHSFQDYWRRLQDLGVIDVKEERSNSARLGFPIKRPKSFYVNGDDGGQDDATFEEDLAVLL